MPFQMTQIAHQWIFIISFSFWYETMNTSCNTKFLNINQVIRLHNVRKLQSQLGTSSRVSSNLLYEEHSQGPTTQNGGEVSPSKPYSGH